jgi:hypothetical protein
LTLNQVVGSQELCWMLSSVSTATKRWSRDQN